MLSTSTAGDLLKMSRQAVDKAVREDRIPGFRDPTTRRLWVERAWVEANAPGGARLLPRVERLEEQVRELQQAATSTVAGGETADPLQSELTSLRAENTTLKETNLLLLAAADAQSQAEELLAQATELDDGARKKRRQAARAARRATGRYRDAVSQTQLPGSVAGVDRHPE